jgi:hypothetical protein
MELWTKTKFFSHFEITAILKTWEKNFFYFFLHSIALISYIVTKCAEKNNYNNNNFRFQVRLRKLKRNFKNLQYFQILILQNSKFQRKFCNKSHKKQKKIGWILRTDGSDLRRFGKY